MPSLKPMCTRGRLPTTWYASLMTVLVAALTCAAPAYGQKDKVHRVAYLHTTTPLSQLRDSVTFPAFVNRLRELGYVEGRNLIVDLYSLEGRLERAPEILAAIVSSKADVIYTPSQSVIERNYQATGGIPVVTLATWNLVGTGLAQSLARPGGTVTGFIFDVDEGVEAKRLELLREVVPRVTRVAYLGVPLLWESPAGKRVRDAAQRLGLSLFHAAYEGADVQAASAVIAREAPEAVFVPLGVASFVYRKQIGEFVSAKRLPCIAGFKELVEFGCLMSYGVDVIDVTVRAAGYVAKILGGAKPGELPIQQPTKFELVINLRAAKTLGITIPQMTLLRADRVIQ